MHTSSLGIHGADVNRHVKRAVVRRNGGRDRADSDGEESEREAHLVGLQGFERKREMDARYRA